MSKNKKKSGETGARGKVVKKMVHKQYQMEHSSNGT